MWKHAAGIIGIVAIQCTTAAAQATQPAERYRVNFSPPSHVGDKVEYRSTQIVSSGTTVGVGNPLHYQESELHFHAVVTVDTCDKRGVPSRLKMKVASLRDVRNPAVEIVEPTKEITARASRVQDDPPRYADVFAEADSPVHPGQEAALRRVISVGGETESTEQEAFGTSEAIPVGGTWSLDGERGTNLLAKMQLSADPKHVKGTAKLVGIRKINDKECLEIQITVWCDDFHPVGESLKPQEEATAAGELEFFLDKTTGRIVQTKYSATVSINMPPLSGDRSKGFTRWSKVSREIRIDDLKK